MDNQEIKKHIANQLITVSEAIQRIDSNQGGILFISDSNDRLVGCITDGDVRRFLLAGGRLSDGVLKAANLSPRFARTLDEAKKIYDSKNFISIPIVNEDERIIDLYNGDDGTRGQKKRKPLGIPVIINAGGKGTRLDPFTRVLPKPLIPVGDLPIIELIMREYQLYSCNDFHIIVNYKRELIKAYFVECERRYSISWYDEEEPLGTGGGLSLLHGKINTTFFFANCDSLLTANYESMLRFHKENNNVITMACAYRNIRIPYGVVEMGINGVIEAMKEKPVVSFLTNTGIYLVEPEVINDVGHGEVIGFPDIVERERQKGKKVAVFPVSENDWSDMGQLSELEKMRTKLYGE